MLKNIEILTANNITIQYEAASLMNRGLALFIDYIVKGIYVIIISIVLTIISLSLGSSEGVVEVLIYIVYILPFMFYSLVMEFLLKGQTIGKLAMGIRVINLNGENASFKDLTMRWVYQIVDFWLSFGGIGALFIATTEKSQRLGDVLANTAVIKNKPTQTYTVFDILNIKDKSKHEPVYLGVTQFTDEDMILIKNAISRYRKYPNNAHKTLIIELSKNITEALGLEEVPPKKISFLNQVLQDFIVLTR